MKKGTKIFIAVIIILIVGAGFLVWQYLGGGQKVSWTTSSGQERGINIPKIPGMELVSEEKGDCSYRVEYVYQIGTDVSEQIKSPLKNAFLKKDWELKKEEVSENGEHILDFYTEKAGVFETMNIKIGFEAGKGTYFVLDYQWPPCSEGSSRAALKTNI